MMTNAPSSLEQSNIITNLCHVFFIDNHKLKLKIQICSDQTLALL